MNTSSLLLYIRLHKFLPKVWFQLYLTVLLLVVALQGLWVRKAAGTVWESLPCSGQVLDCGANLLNFPKLASTLQRPADVSLDTLSTFILLLLVYLRTWAFTLKSIVRPHCPLSKEKKKAIKLEQGLLFYEVLSVGKPHCIYFTVSIQVKQHTYDHHVTISPICVTIIALMCSSEVITLEEILFWG